MNTKKKAGIRSLLPLFCIISLLLAGRRPAAELETAPEPLPYEPDTAPRSAVPPAERLLSYQVAGSGFYQMPDEQRFSTALYAYNTCYFNQIRDQMLLLKEFVGVLRRQEVSSRTYFFNCVQSNQLIRYLYRLPDSFCHTDHLVAGN